MAEPRQFFFLAWRGCPRRGLRRLGRWLACWGALVALLLPLVFSGVSEAPLGGSAAWAAPAPVAPLPAPAPAVPPASSPPAVWVELEGRRVLELRRVAGAQNPQEVAVRASQRLRGLAEDHRIDPAWLVVREDPPYSMIGIEKPGGRFQPLLAVDDRASASFALERPQLAERYRDQLRGAIRQYRSSHSPSAWLRGTALALAVLLVFLLWLRLQIGLNARLAAWLAASHRPLPAVRLGSIHLLDELQLRELLQWLRRFVHWSLLLLVSYLLLPLLLGLFPPTQAIAEGLRSHMLRVVEGLLAGLVGSVPNLVSIALILAITGMVIRASNAWFSEIGRGRLQIPGFYPEWAQP
ncbi:MAG: hypothetical protein ACKOZW_05720, partial [Cyanobium sp.]